MCSNCRFAIYNTFRVLELICHIGIYLRITNDNQFIKNLKKYDRSSKKWKHLTGSVTYCLVKDMLPLYTVEKELMKASDVQYYLPN